MLGRYNGEDIQVQVRNNLKIASYLELTEGYLNLPLARIKIDHHSPLSGNLLFVSGADHDVSIIHEGHITPPTLAPPPG